MAQRESDPWTARDCGIQSAARRLRNGGGVVVVCATVLTVAGMVAALAGGLTLAGTVALTLTAFGTAAPAGQVEWLLHVGTLGFVAGVWLVGAGLLAEGLLEVERP